MQGIYITYAGKLIIKMSEVTVRTVEKSDVSDIRKYLFVRNTLSEVKKRITENVEKQQNGELVQFVAVLDEKIVGTMMISFQSHPLYAHRCTLDDVVVTGDYQGRGIAHAIFEKCVAECKKMKIKYILTGVRGGEPAEMVYHKLGFVEYGRLKAGIIEPWNNNAEYDDVLLAFEVK